MCLLKQYVGLLLGADRLSNAQYRDLNFYLWLNEEVQYYTTLKFVLARYTNLILLIHSEVI